MSKPNINIPAEFAINGTKTDFSQAKITDGFDRLQPDVLPGDNLNKFIDDTYKGLNGVLELYEGCVLYDSTVVYNNTSIVFYINADDEVEVYRSLINNNLNNPLSDNTAWEKVIFVDSNKANIDGSNMVSSVKNFDGAWVGSLLTAFSNVTLNTTPRTVDLSSYLPNDGYDYLVCVTILGKPNSAGIIAIILGDYYTQVRARGAVQNVNSESSGYIVVGNDRTVQCSTITGTWTTAELRFFSYRRIGTNQ